jgi:hypothetical protein
VPVHYLCDSCGYRGFDPTAESADEVLCEACGEPVLADPDTPPSENLRRNGMYGRRLELP